MTEVHFIGLDEVLEKLDKNARPYVQKGSMAIAKEIEGTVGKYPPAGPYNMPGGPGSQWYKRGYGSRYMTVGGVVRDYGTSEDLGKKWTVAKLGKTGASLKNPASYAKFVHSAEDQCQFHGAHGWVTDEDAVRKVVDSGVIPDIMIDAIFHGIGWGRP
jgi:hypothetical protein